jgi:hypothetical protein
MTAEYVQLVNRRRQVQTSARTFRHPATGQTVTVIGTYHLGEPGYFTGLKEAIDKLQANGAIVQCEGSSLLTCDETNATTEEREVLAQLRRATALADQCITDLGWGWVGQAQGMPYPSSWQVVDLNTLEIIRALGVPLARIVAQNKLRQFDRTNLRWARLGLALLMRFVSQDWRLVKAARRANATDEVLIHRRNTVALAGVASTTQDVVLIWGLIHLPGLDAGLADQGFVRSDDPQWHVVARRPKISGALRRLVLR